MDGLLLPMLLLLLLLLLLGVENNTLHKMDVKRFRWISEK
jgi:hypothetical protein